MAENKQGEMVMGISTGQNPFTQLQFRFKELENGLKDWLSKQSLPVEAAVVTATSSVQGVLMGAIMGTFTNDVSSSLLVPPLGSLDPKVMASFQQSQGTFAGPVTKDDLGRATWTFLHTLAAQFPDSPTRQQKKDVKELMGILSRMYPCKECADHFKEVLRSNPVQVGSQAEFARWLCHVHNVVNRSLGKLAFPCERVDARWGKLGCEQRACDLQGTLMDINQGARKL